MKKQLLIIGGGFAGFWSAISAVRQSRDIRERNAVDITLINPDNHVTIRPALNESYTGGMSFELDKYLKPLGVRQIIGRVNTITPEENKVAYSTAEGIHELVYDYVVLSAGAAINLPDLPGIEYTFNVDSFDKARILEDHIIGLAKKDFSTTGANTFVVVGSELTGLETVTSIEQKIRTIQAGYSQKKSDFNIILVESADEPGVRFSKECMQYIQDVIIAKQIEVIANREVIAVEPAALMLNDGAHIPTATVIWTKGMLASSLTRFFKAPKDDVNRLVVDPFLKFTGYPNAIAAGNVAHTVNANNQSFLMDCQYAQFEGRWAGHNAVNDLFNVPLKEYVQPEYIPCLDLGEPPTTYISGWELAMQKQKYKKIAVEKHMNLVTMYPWQDVEETVRASYPEIPKFK